MCNRSRVQQQVFRGHLTFCHVRSQSFCLGLVPAVPAFRQSCEGLFCRGDTVAQACRIFQQCPSFCQSDGHNISHTHDKVHCRPFLSAQCAVELFGQCLRHTFAEILTQGIKLCLDHVHQPQQGNVGLCGAAQIVQGCPSRVPSLDAVHEHGHTFTLHSGGFCRSHCCHEPKHVEATFSILVGLAFCSACNGASGRIRCLGQVLRSIVVGLVDLVPERTHRVEYPVLGLHLDHQLAQPVKLTTH